MKKRYFFCLLWSVLTFGASGQTLSGTYAVGPGSTYSNLTDVSLALTQYPLSGNVVFELQSNYVCSTETFPIVFKQFSSPGGTYTVTLRPATGVTALTEGVPANGLSLIRLDSADRYIFDGRAGGAGGIAWIIRNKSAAASPLAAPVASTSAGPVFHFVNDACYDTLMYLQAEGMNPVAASALIYFDGTTGTLGNSNNVITYCKIRDRSDTTAGTGCPATALNSTGNASSMNRFNTLSYSQVYNFFYKSTQAHGIRLETGSSDWTINDNQLYQENARTFTAAANHKGIRVNNATGSNFKIYGNTIGYASASGTGMFSFSGPNNTNFTAIEISISPTGNSLVRRNLIKNISFTTVSTLGSLTAFPSGYFEGIHLEYGNLLADSNNVGDTTGVSINIIISAPPLSLSTGVPLALGIVSGRPQAVISNNIVSGFMINNPTSGTARSGFYGISSVGGSIIRNNLVGSRSLPSSINNSTGNAAITGVHPTAGIYISTLSSEVINNTIANISYSGGSTVAQVIGISSTGTTGNQKIGTLTNGSGNTIYNLFSNAGNLSTGASAAIIGILQTNTVQGQVICQNSISSLYCTHTSALTNINGICFTGAATGEGDLVSRNLIHGLVAKTSNNNAFINGIYISQSSAKFVNNMICLGFDSAGNSVTNGYAFCGINNVPAGTGIDHFYHNTIYIGGSGVSSNSNTYAINRGAATNTTNVYNNILVNARSNASGIAKNYVLKNNNAGYAGLNSGYNLFSRPGTGGMLFASSFANLDSLSSWQSSLYPYPDLGSAVGDPLLMNPSGGRTNIDLRPQSSTPVESSGKLIATVTDDYDGNDRSLLSPADIGAAAGNFTRSSDIFPPVINYIAPGKGVVSTSRTLTAFANITGNSSTALGLSKPRLYYKKPADANTYIFNANGVDGWKYAMATNNSSPFSFTIDYSILNAGSVSFSDTIQFFVVAQDSVDNLGYYPPSAYGASTPPVQAISIFPANPDKFMITAGISGLKTVCPSGCDFNSLTRNGGLFQSIDSLAVSGNITAMVQGDLLEDGTYALNNFGSSYRLTIQPDATQRTISNITDLPPGTPMINLNGASNVTINGGISKNLLFKNSNATPANTSACIQFTADASADSLINCLVQGTCTNASRAIVVVNGVSNLTIIQNELSNISSLAAKPAVALLFNSVSNSAVTVSNNNIYNFTANGIYLAAFGNGCNINGNSFYNNFATSPTAAVTSILAEGGSGIIVNSNYIGGQAPLLGGSSWMNASAGPVYGISSTTPGTISILNNQVANINSTGVGILVGINAISSNSPFIIQGNSIHDLVGAGSVGGTIIALGGISIAGSNTQNQVTQNTIFNLHSNAASGSPGISGIGQNDYNTVSPYIAGADISANKIYNFTSAMSTTTPDIRGIGPLQSNNNSINVNITNNFISLGESISNDASIEGIFNNARSASSVNIFYNTVYISGTAINSSAVNNSSGYLRDQTGSGGQVRDNIFYNARTSSGGTAAHMSIANTAAAPTGTGWNSDYNLLFSTDSTNSTGRWGSTNYGFTAFKNISVNESHSMYSSLFFNSPVAGNLHLAGTSVGNMVLKGMPLTAVIKDIDAQTRSTLYPYMGADEVPTSPLPVKFLAINAIVTGDGVLITWSTALEINCSRYEVERSTDGKNWSVIQQLGCIGGNKKVRYAYVDLDAFAISKSAVLQYRIRQTDIDGQYILSTTLHVAQGKVTASQLKAEPNPFGSILNLVYTAATEGEAMVEIFDMRGISLKEMNFALHEGTNTLAFNKLADIEPGVYFAVLSFEGETVVVRILRE